VDNARCRVWTDSRCWLRAKQATVRRACAPHSYRHEVVGRMLCGLLHAIQSHANRELLTNNWQHHTASLN